MARTSGSIPEKYSVPSFQEWKSEPIELLVESNRKGLLGNLAGGTKIYKKFEDVMKN